MDQFVIKIPVKCKSEQSCTNTSECTGTLTTSDLGYVSKEK